jgi:molecular chaperone GrpE
LPEEEETSEVRPRERGDEEERDIEIGGDDDAGEDAPRHGSPDHGAKVAGGTGGIRTSGHPRKKGRHEKSQRELEREIESLGEELGRVSTELEETKDKFLRGLADFDNYRKRVNREREQLVRCANEDLIKRFLEVVDNLERALAAASDTHDLDAFKQGVELIYQHLKEVLTREGLCPIACLGEAFDPNFHEAVMALEKDGEEPEKVIEEIQKGYTLDGRVIRPSKVVVSK